MRSETFCYTKDQEDAFRDRIELEALVPVMPTQFEKTTFRNQFFAIIDNLEEKSRSPFCKGLIRKAVARFQDVYFFYNKTGDVCCLTDF